MKVLRMLRGGKGWNKKTGGRAEQQFHSVCMWCCLTWEGGGEGKGDMSINSCYIASLCWCQVAERKERRESAVTLFFTVVRPHLAPFLSVSFHSGLVSMDTDRLCVYPTLQQGPRRSPLFLLHPPLLLSLRSLLDHHVLLYSPRHPSVVPPSSLLFKCYRNTDGVLIRQHRFCHEVCKELRRNTTEAATWLEMKVDALACDSLSVRCNLTYISEETIKWMSCFVFLYCGVPAWWTGFCLGFSDSLKPLNSV